MNEYTSRAFGLKMQLPEGWIAIENKEMGGVQVFTPAAAANSSNETYSDNLSLIVRRQEGAHANDASLLSFITSEIIRSNYASYTNYALISLQTQDLNGTPIRESLYTYQDTKRDHVMSALQIVYLKDHKIHLFTFTAKDNTFVDNLETVREIIQSIQDI
jgi:hypothetical protein